MGLAIAAYAILAGSGGWLFYLRQTRQPRPAALRPFHYITGSLMVLLVLLLLGIGIVGTLGHYGTLGHSPHLIAGIVVVNLTLLSAWSAARIHPSRPWARTLHLSCNALLFLAFAFVSWSGWSVVQKYLE